MVAGVPRRDAASIRHQPPLRCGALVLHMHDVVVHGVHILMRHINTLLCVLAHMVHARPKSCCSWTAQTHQRADVSHPTWCGRCGHVPPSGENVLLTAWWRSNLVGMVAREISNVPSARRRAN